jgi:YesN/AraC family two-component response regulator
VKVLIVEDDKSSRLYLENLLELNNYEFRSAGNGIEGLNIYEEFQPEIVITDIQMPLMDGLEMVEAIRDRQSDTIIIITTAYGSENYAIQALHLGANNYLKKPIAGMDLLPLLRKYKNILDGKYRTYGELPGTILYRKFAMQFKTDLNAVPSIVDRLLIESACNFENNERINIELGLVELITNAFEHGNLEINFEEKINAMNENRLEELYENRLANPKFQNRMIEVDYVSDCDGCQWTIRDEGKGFNWRTLPNPTEEENILELGGRGIFITGFLFDELEYSGNGNIVRVKKYFDHENQPEGAAV